MKIGKDKWMHFGVCLVLAVAFSAIMAALSRMVDVSIATGALCAVCVGAGKEYGDGQATDNHFCWYDLLADCLGALTGSLAGLTALLY